MQFNLKQRNFKKKPFFKFWIFILLGIEIIWSITQAFWWELKGAATYVINQKIKGLCLMKCSRKMLQFAIFLEWENSSLFFSLSISCFPLIANFNRILLVYCFLELISEEWCTLSTTQFKLILRTRFTFQQRRTGTNEKSNERSRSIETDLGG